MLLCSVIFRAFRRALETVIVYILDSATLSCSIALPTDARASDYAALLLTASFSLNKYFEM